MNRDTIFLTVIFLFFTNLIIAQADSAFIVEKVNLAQKNISKFEKAKNKTARKLNKCVNPLMEVIKISPENYAVNASLGFLYHNYCIYLLEKSQSNILFFKKTRLEKILSDMAFYSEQSLIYLTKAKELKSR